MDESGLCSAHLQDVAHRCLPELRRISQEPSDRKTSPANDLVHRASGKSRNHTRPILRQRDNFSSRQEARPSLSRIRDFAGVLRDRKKKNRAGRSSTKLVCAETGTARTGRNVTMVTN